MDPVEEIKDRLSIDDVVGRYVDLKRSGGSYKGLCPFHSEKTPSFYVTPSRGMYKCFGCGKGGDIFSFVMEMEHLPFPDALKRLADQAGVRLPDREPQAPSLKKRLYEANDKAADLFRSFLEGAAGDRARSYLERRGFGSQASTLFDLGYAPDGRDTLTRALHTAGFDDRVLLAAGLALQDDAGSSTRDRFRSRVMFPIRDQSGRISGFGGRAVADIQPKYLNSPQTEIFDKSGVLFGIHLATDAIRQAGHAILVEGYLDAVRAHLGGYLQTVASLGTAVTARQLSALARLTDTVILALDPDPAGQSAAARTSLQALNEVTRARGRAAGGAAALDLRIARLPAGLGDPDEMLRDHPDAWDAALRASVPAFEFYFETVMNGLDRSDPGWRQTAIDALLPPIQQFATSPGWQAIWIERLAAETGVSAQAITRSAGSSGPTSRSSRAPSRPRDTGRERVNHVTAEGLTRNPVQEVESGLLALLLQLVVIPDETANLLEDIHLHTPHFDGILRALLAWRTNGNYDYELFRAHLSADEAEVADSLRGRSTPLPGDGKTSIAVAYHLARLRHFRLQADLLQASQTLGDVSPEDRPAVTEAVLRMTAERKEIEVMLDELSRQVIKSGPAVS